MEGQGTVGLEIAEDCKARGITKVDSVLVPTGGGGLLAGCCVALAHEMPETKIYAVEPAGYDDHLMSFKAGKRVTLEGKPALPTLCDSLQAVGPGKNTWPITSRHISGVFAVTDDEVRYAMRVAFETLQVVLEPGGACGLAAVLSGKLDVVGKTIVVHATGGNTSLEKFAKALGCEGDFSPSSCPALPTSLSRGFDWTGVQCESIPGLTRPLLLLKARHGFLACGYISTDTCDKLKEACAIVTGVNSAEDMLNTKVVRLSAAAAALGVKEGMLGAEALALLKRGSSKL